MAKRFYTRLTAAGEQRLAEAAVSGAPVNITQMAVGDGNGSVPEPANREDLLNEVYRAPLNRLVIADQAANVIRAEMLILPQTGGFWMREAALYDDDGVCLAVANLPESYKPKLAEGSGRLHAVNVWIAISSTENVQLIAEPSVIMATVDEIERAKNEVKDYVDQLLGDTITAAKRDFWEEDNPPGTVRFFAQNIDPNEKWPWSQWTYTGENKTIRVGKADGSNVGSTGGSDTVTIQQANLPAVQINVNGSTGEHPGGYQETTDNGAHNHQGGDGAPGASWQNATHGTDNQKSTTFNNTSDAPAHKHGFTIPPHSHTVTGKTANLGEGKSFSVVESHTLLMCWARVA